MARHLHGGWTARANAPVQTAGGASGAVTGRRFSAWSVVGVIGQVDLDTIPVNVGLEDWPLRNSRQKRIALGRDPAHSRCSYSKQCRMKAVDDSKNNEDAKSEADKPQYPGRAGGSLQAVTLLDGLPSRQ